MSAALRYEDLHVHRWMLRDRARVRAFDEAIQRCVKPGDVVLDVGAGSGILSLMAARAGAARVYAVERTPVAGMARRLAQRNGYADVVKVAQGDIQHLSLPEPVDVIVSEWLGTIGVDENLLFPVLQARDRWLKPGGMMLPARVTAQLAPAWLATACEVKYLHEPLLGFDLAALGETSVHDLLCRRYQVRADGLAAPARAMWTTDTTTAALSESLAPHRCELTFEMAEPTRVNALVAWFDAELAPGVGLSNAPDAPETHWGQLTLPLDRAIDLAVGAKLQVRVACQPRIPGLSDLAWSLRVDDGPWQHHNTLGAGESSVLVWPDSATPSESGDPAMQPTTPSHVQLPSPKDAAPLTCFLARLSVDPDMLFRLIRDPQAVFQESGLAEDDIAALRSRQAAPIEQAMMKGAAP